MARKPKAPPWLFDRIDEASKNARKIYFLYVTFLAYCTLTVVSTSDRQIILNETATLPILKLDVPLNGFFIVGPLMGILVFIYFQLYLYRLKGLIDDLRTNYAPIEKRRLYPWMINIAEDPEPGAMGALQRIIVSFSLWTSLTLVLILFALWYVKKHEPIWSYIVGTGPIVGALVTFWFWFQYELGKLGRSFWRKIFSFVGFSFVIAFELCLFFFLIPWAREGGKDKWIRPLICINLSHQKLVTEPKTDYKGLFWGNFNKAHLEGAILVNAVLKRADLRGAHLQNADMNSAILEKANLANAYLEHSNLGGADLRGANLRQANLERANLKEANLQEAVFDGVLIREADLQRADFRGAKGLINIKSARNWPLALYSKEILYGLKLPLDHNERVVKNDFRNYSFAKIDLQWADLRGANLQEADLKQVNLKWAVLSEANLQKADLGGANVQIAILVGANLQEAFLGGADLQETDLYKALLPRANLRGAILRDANLQEADLGGANLQKADFIRANLQRAFLGGTYLQKALLRNANLQKAILRNANLQEATLRDANLQEALLGGANFEGANLEGANLQKADLGGVNLQRAILVGANLQETFLGGANLQKADLRRANLQGSRNLTVKQLSEVKTLYEATLDQNLEEQIKEKYPHLLKKPKED